MFISKKKKKKTRFWFIANGPKSKGYELIVKKDYIF